MFGLYKSDSKANDSSVNYSQVSSFNSTVKSKKDSGLSIGKGIRRLIIDRREFMSKESELENEEKNRGDNKESVPKTFERLFKKAKREKNKKFQMISERIKDKTKKELKNDKRERFFLQSREKMSTDLTQSLEIPESYKIDHLKKFPPFVENSFKDAIRQATKVNKTRIMMKSDIHSEKQFHKGHNSNFTENLFNLDNSEVLAKNSEGEPIHNSPIPFYNENNNKSLSYNKIHNSIFGRKKFIEDIKKDELKEAEKKKRELEKLKEELGQFSSQNDFKEEDACKFIEAINLITLELNQIEETIFDLKSKVNVDKSFTNEPDENLSNLLLKINPSTDRKRNSLVSSRIKQKSSSNSRKLFAHNNKIVKPRFNLNLSRLHKGNEIHTKEKEYFSQGFNAEYINEKRKSNTDRSKGSVFERLYKDSTDRTHRRQKINRSLNIEREENLSQYTFTPRILNKTFTDKSEFHSRNKEWLEKKNKKLEEISSKKHLKKQKEIEKMFKPKINTKSKAIMSKKKDNFKERQKRLKEKKTKEKPDMPKRKRFFKMYEWQRAKIEIKAVLKHFGSC